jgi:MoaA/NifB/PqqE/SkfB family radical SAM enzyme
MNTVRAPSGDARSCSQRALRGYLATGAAPAPCQALRASVMVGPTGEVHPCHLRGERLGNVREAGLSLAQVLAAPPARTLSRRLALEGCAGCWTPCEAYHAIVAAPLRAAARAWVAEGGL